MNGLNPTEDLELDSKLTPEEDSDEDLKFLDELDEEPEDSEEEPDGSEKALEQFNTELKKRGLNKNYKSWDDVAKSEKQRDIDFAKKGMDKKEEVIEKKEEVVEKLPSNLSERLLRVEKPESAFILDEIKKDHPGKDVLEVYESSEYYQKEALVRAENERNKQRIANPSGNTEGQPEVDETEQKFMNNLPNKYKK